MQNIVDPTLMRRLALLGIIHTINQCVRKRRGWSYTVSEKPWRYAPAGRESWVYRIKARRSRRQSANVGAMRLSFQRRDVRVPIEVIYHEPKPGTPDVAQRVDITITDRRYLEKVQEELAKLSSALGLREDDILIRTMT